MTQRKPYPKLPSVALFRSTVTQASRAMWRPRLVGREHFPRKGPCFVYGNHSNRWDPFIINNFTPWPDPTAGVMTREFLRGDFLARLFGAIGIIPASKRLAEPFLVRRVLEQLGRDRKVVIFPEGESRWDGRPLPWMTATAKLFVRAGVPVHPLRIHGSYHSWPRWADYPRWTPVTIEALPPLRFERSTPVEEALATLRAATDFEEDCYDPPPAFECVDDVVRPGRCRKPASGIHRLLYRNPWDDSGPMTSADGRTVQTVSGSRVFDMLLDSSLVDQQTGERYRVSDLYRRIQQMPVSANGDGQLLAERVDVHVETEFPEITEVGAAEAQLFRGRIELRGAMDRTIDLEQVLYADVERNFKLQLYLRDDDVAMIQLGFSRSGSALQWKDVLLQIHPELVKY